MWFLWVLIVVLAILLVIVIAAIVASSKRIAKTNHLMKVADLSFKKRNTTHDFRYAIKQFRDEGSRKIKIIIVAYTNITDMKNLDSNTNCSFTGKVTLVGATSGKENVSEYKLGSLQPNITVEVPEELRDESLHVKVETDWSFGGTPLKEELEFDLD